MPVGAIIGSTVVGVGGTVAGASASKSAAKKAAATQADTTAANNALVTQTYNRNEANLSPFMRNGVQASNALNELLLGPSASPVAPQDYQMPQGSVFAPYAPANDVIDADFTVVDDPTYGGLVNPRVPLRLQQAGVDAYRSSRPAATNALSPFAVQPAAMQPVASSAPPAPSAFDRYRESTGYQFRLGQGANALNAQYAGRGLLESGAAQKALVSYGQNMASGEFGNYVGALQGQQTMGMSGANALAGVSTNMANTISGNNQASGSALANAQLMNGAATQNMWGNLAGSAANAAGQLNSLGSSYGMQGYSWGGRAPARGGVF